MTERGKKRIDGQRERILDGLKRTKTGETICLADWQAMIVVRWIEELERKVEEQNGNA